MKKILMFSIFFYFIKYTYIGDQMKRIRIIQDIKSYILDEEFKLLFLNNRVNISNYTSIGHFDSNKVIVKYDKGEAIVKGNELVVSKLMNDEILIVGNINNIEFR